MKEFSRVFLSVFPVRATGCVLGCFCPGVYAWITLHTRLVCIILSVSVLLAFFIHLVNWSVFQSERYRLVGENTLDCCDRILPLLLSHSLLPVYARTNRHAGSSAGDLDYCEEPAGAPSLPSRAGDSYFSGGVKLEVVPLTIFFLARQRQKPHVRTPAYPVPLYSADLRPKPLAGSAAFRKCSQCEASELMKTQNPSFFYRELHKREIIN